MITMLYLFGSFFIKSYVKPKPNSAGKQASKEE
jgi:hypothetical protein